MSPITVSDDTIVQEVTIKAPAARIFAALTSPEQLVKWWALPCRFKATHVECDPRPGGRWRMEVEGLCAGERAVNTVSGEYRAVEPPRLLIFTWIRDEDQAETEVRWDLDERDGLTTVRVTHSGLATEYLRSRNSGWPLVVKLLAEYAEQHG